VITLEACRTEPAEDICDCVMDDARTFSFGGQDDRTFLVLKAIEEGLPPPSRSCGSPDPATALADC
jgi:hypothetical protein